MWTGAWPSTYDQNLTDRRTLHQHLVNYLNELHHFYFSTVKNMNRQDAHDVTEAIAHVIAAVPLGEHLTAMKTFCHPIAQRLHEIAARGKPANEAEQVQTVKQAAGKSCERIASLTSSTDTYDQVC